MLDFDQFTQVQEGLKAGHFTCAAMVEAYLDRIEKRQDLNLFVEVYAKDARSRATVIDAKLHRGTAGSLAGLVVGLKDNIVYAQHGASAASRMLQDFESLFSATVVERLLAEDAIIIGRLNCDEFAMGSANRHSHYGPARNPHDRDKVPGGSSGGSAAAVAAGLCQVALGSDTGGSIRQPAAFCGTIGFKPGYGQISRYGLIAFASSFDQIGPFARSVADTKLLYDCLAGPDDKDSTLNRSQMQVPVTPANEPLKIAYFKEVLEHPRLDAELRKAAQEQIGQLQAAGHQVEAVSFPMLDYLVPVYYIISTAEASSNLARYDGVHFGYRSDKAHDLESTYKYSRSEGFGPEVKRRILLGTFVLSSGFYDAYYAKAQKARRAIVDATEELFAKYDLLFSPTTPHPAFAIDAPVSDPTQMYLEDIFTVHANICGIPAISLPMSSHSSGLPLGWQFTAPKNHDQRLLAFAERLMSSHTIKTV